MHYWSKSQMLCEYTGAWPRGLNFRTVFEYQMPFIEATKCVLITERYGLKVWVLQLPEPVVTPEAYFVALCRRTDIDHAYMRHSDGSRFFTLERSMVVDQPFFCEWTSAGEHLNFGMESLLTCAQLEARVRAQIEGNHPALAGVK